MKRFELHEIRPAIGDKFSPNLYKFIKKYGSDCVEMDVWRNADGHLWIGYTYDGDFIGNQLNFVLCNGTKSGCGCYSGRTGNFTRIPDFWEHYKAIGRCAIDKAHVVPYLNSDSRYVESGDIRTCQWCGLEQVRRTWTETITKEKWETAPTRALAHPHSADSQE